MEFLGKDLKSIICFTNTGLKFSSEIYSYYIILSLRQRWFDLIQKIALNDLTKWRLARNRPREKMVILGLQRHEEIEHHGLEKKR